MTDRRFALLGAAGYVSPKHLKAIRDVGGDLLVALDPSDSVGILDKYFPDCAFFTEPERFWRWMAKRDFEGKPKPNWVSVCSPNWLHDAHVRMALAEGCKVILEKPAFLTTRNLDCIINQYPETLYGSVYVMHQLRWHERAKALRDLVGAIKVKNPEHRFEVTIVYHTPRGPWYRYSWKGDHERSGGPVANLGIHFLDMVVWLFGKSLGVSLSDKTTEHVVGQIKLETADVEFSLSTAPEDSVDGKPQRVFEIDSDMKWDFSAGFEDLHTEVYRSAINGIGVSLAEAREAIRIAEEIRLTSPAR